MSFNPDNNVQLGAFGELITAHKTPIVQIANKYKQDPAVLNEIEIFEATGGSADNIGNMFRCQSGTSVGGYGVVRSMDTINYKAGQGIEGYATATFTTGIANSLQFAGMFSLTETLAFGYNGTAFSILHSYDGVAELQEVVVTATPSIGENCTVTLDNDAVVIALTNSTVQTNAFEIQQGLEADGTVSAKWRFEQVDDTVICISKSVGDKTGTFSFSSATATGTVTEITAGVAQTDDHVAQASWNITTAPFAGFDPTKFNIYKVVFGYLGAADIVYSIYNPVTRVFVDVHQIEWANANTSPHLGSPNLKIGWTSASLGSSGTNLTVTGGSGAMFLEGDEVTRNNTFANSNTVLAVGPTLTNLLTIKNRLSFGGQFNLGKIIPVGVSINNDHNKGAIIEIYRMPDVAGIPNFQYEEENNSIAIVDKAGTTVTNGVFIGGGTVAAGGSEDIDLFVLQSEVLPDQKLVICAKTISGTSTSISATGTWKERK